MPDFILASVPEMQTAFAAALAETVAPHPKAVAISPNDTSDFIAGPARALFVGGAGDVRCKDVQGNVFVVKSAAAQYHNISISRVFVTGTTATDILALY